MSKKHKSHAGPGSWLRNLFRQPPVGLYNQPSVYISGAQMEIENFKRISLYDENKLCLELYHGSFTVYGEEMKILTLAAHRITLCGQFLKTEFSEEIDRNGG